MGRPIKSDSEKKAKILITINKSIYLNMKKHKIKISTYINSLLKIALNKGVPNDYQIENFAVNPQTHNLESASPNLVRGTF